jgi:hypothetical protein
MLKEKASNRDVYLLPLVFAILRLEVFNAVLAEELIRKI